MQVSMGTGNAPIDGSAIRNVLVREGSVVFLNDVIAEPTAATGDGSVVLYRYGGALKYWNGTSAITLAAGGGGGTTPTYESLFAYDQTFNITPDTTWTIQGNRATATAVVTLANIAGGSGAVLAFSNLGSGNDITGTSSLWSVTAAGVATFAGVSISGTTSAFANTGAAVWTMVDNTATALTFDATGKTGLLKFTTTDGAEGIATSGFLTVSGKITGGVGSNTVSSAVITDNTVTTFGNNASSAGVVVIRSTSLTTGALLQLQTAETTLNGGYYLVARDSIAGANVFTIGELGAHVITGVAGSDMMTITAGDLNMGSGRIYATYATNGAALSITNNTVTSTNNVLVTGSGTFTGVGASSYFNITASGLTTGTALTVIANTANTSVGVVDIATTGLQSGSSLRITESTANFTTGGKAIEVAMVAATAGNGLTVTTTGAYTGTGLAVLTAGAMTTGIVLSLTSTTGLTSGSVIRATTSTAGLIATNGAFAFTGTGAFTGTTVGLFTVQGNTSTAGLVADIEGNGMIGGGVLSLSATSLTTGFGLLIANGTSAITTGSLVRVTGSGVGTLATNGLVSVTHGGIFVSTANAGILDVRATAAVGAATVADFQSTAASQTAVTVLNVVQSGATLTAYTGTIAAFTGGFSGASSTGAIIGVTAVNDVAGDAIKITNNALTLGAGTLINLVHGTSVIGAGSSMLRLTSTGVDTGTTTGTMIDLAATAATAATLMVVTSATLTTGSGIKMTLNGLTSGAGLTIASSSADTTARGLLNLTSSSGSATGAAAIRSAIAKQTTHFQRMWTDSVSGVTFWFGDGSTANAALTGSAGDILFNGGSNKPEYCTGTTNWTALV